MQKPLSPEKIQTICVWIDFSIIETISVLQTASMRCASEHSAGIAESSLLDPISIWAVAIQDAASCVMSCQQPTPNPIR